MKRIFATLFLLNLTFFYGFSQNHFPDLVREKLSEYQLTDHPEKVYVHTDKPYYLLNESIWFTGYLVNGITNTQSDKSAVLYVELINDKDVVLAKKKLLIEKVSVAGDFKIPKNWKQGKYLLRSYTNEMRNKDPNYFFQKEISIWDTQKNDSLQSQRSLVNQVVENTEVIDIPRLDLHFYPESGYLVEGILNKVAIKIKDSLFENANISGIVIDNKGTEILKFETLKFGLGVFSFAPEPNKSYSAIINVNNVEEHYPLPKALPEGYVINVLNNGDHVLVEVNSTTDTGLRGTFLVAHQRGDHIYSNFEESSKNKYTIKIITTEFKDGVTHLTLFDSSGNPVCERLIYINNPNNSATVEIKKSEDLFKTRQKITVNLDVKSKTGASIPSVLSMSVRDLRATPYNYKAGNIRTWLLLNSDLRGEVKNPGYFFENENNFKKRYLLDLVMLTNGWRRFIWDDLLYKPKERSIFPIEKGIHISGRTLNLKKPYNHTTASIRLSFVTLFHQDTQQSSTNGKFNFGPYIFRDTIPTLLEARLTNFKSKEEKNRKVLIHIDKPIESPAVTRNGILKSSFSDESQIAGFLKTVNYTQQLNFEFGINSNLLEEVTVRAKRSEEVDERTQEMNERTLYGEPSDRIIMDDEDDASYRSIFDLLRRVSGVNVSGTSVSIRGGGTPAFYLDGMEIDSSYIGSLHGSNIAFIDVLKGVDAAMFSNSGNGVIALYSDLGSNVELRNVKRKPGIIDFISRGFCTAKEFYAPNHIFVADEIFEVDVRTTLYWDPQIRITENSKKEISFYTCDAKGDYIIEIEGISDAGEPIHGLSTFTVQ